MELDSFDFGAELSEELNHIRVWPKLGEMTALIDGDLLPYIIGYAVPDIMWLRAQNRVESGSCASISETPEFEEIKQKLCMTLNRWVTQAGCDSAYIYMTDSAKNFRLNIAIQRQYKGTRRSEKPPFFYESRAFMIEHLGAILSDGEEADDLITIHMNSEHNRLRENGIAIGSPVHKEVSALVCVSKDKDLAITSGWHLDVGKGELHWVTVLGELHPRWTTSKKTGKTSIDQIKGTGLKFFYAQMLLGDGVDNYTGIPRMLKRDIFDLLDPCKTEAELYYAVLGAYERKYTKQGSYIENFRGGGRLMKPYEIMHEQGRLAHMQRFKGEVWRSEKVPVLLGSDPDLWK